MDCDHLTGLLHMLVLISFLKIWLLILSRNRDHFVFSSQHLHFIGSKNQFKPVSVVCKNGGTTFIRGKVSDQKIIHQQVFARLNQ